MKYLRGDLKKLITSAIYILKQNEEFVNSHAYSELPNLATKSKEVRFFILDTFESKRLEVLLHLAKIDPGLAKEWVENNSESILDIKFDILRNIIGNALPRNAEPNRILCELVASLSCKEGTKEGELLRTSITNYINSQPAPGNYSILSLKRIMDALLWIQIKPLREQWNNIKTSMEILNGTDNAELQERFNKVKIRGYSDCKSSK